jgi:nicotinamide-nucleotide amidase
VSPCLDALDLPGAPPATIAFLASGMEGIKVRVTAKAPDTAHVDDILDEQEQKLRSILGELVFGVDADTMESVTARLLVDNSLTLGLAESLTGGLIASRLVGVPGASTWFRGGVVSYASDVKFDVLGVDPGPVVSAAAARQMARGARHVLGADIGLSVTGVAGPDEQEGQPVGTVFIGLAVGLQDAEAIELRLPGDRERVRQYAAISALNILRQRLQSL